MRRFDMLLSLSMVMLCGTLALQTQPAAIAQEATPLAEEFTEEGITFEPLAFATGIALPATGDLSLARISVEPGTEFPIDAGDPAYALAVIERGELTVRLDGVLTVMRAETLSGDAAEEEAGATPGQEVMLHPGDTALFPPNVGGEVRNDGQERAVVLVAFVGPSTPEASPTAATPMP